MSRPTLIAEAMFPDRVMRTQIVSSAAEALSGVTQLDLQNHRANMVWLTVAGNDIRYAFDGTSPTTTVGHVLPADSPPLLIEGRGRILQFRMIGDGGASATVTFTLDQTRERGGLV